jgi:plasmid stabilization system protein ParE
MSLPVRYRVAATNDITRRTNRYARIDPDLARRFVQAIGTTETAISQSPGLGIPFPTTRKRLTNLRCRSVIGFDDVLVFYLEKHDEIIILRVLHAHQDLSRIFPTNGQH